MYPHRLTAPQIHTLQAIRLPDIQRVQLPNGAGLTIIDSGTQPVTRISVVWPLGMMYYPHKAATTLHRSMLQNGPAAFAPGEFPGIFEFHGAWFTPALTNTKTHLTLSALNSALPLVLEPMCQAITDCNYRPDDLHALANQAAYKQSLSLKRVEYRAMQASLERIFGPDHPRGSLLAPENLLGVTLADVERLHRHKMLGMTPEIYLAGKISDDIVQLVERTLGIIAFGSALPPARIPAAGFSADERIHCIVPDAVQAAVNITIPVPDRQSPDYERLRLANYALGGYFGSRLMANIREDKGYTYGISSQIESAPELSKITIACQADARYVDAIIAEAEAEIRRLATEPMSADELHTVKQMFMTTLTSVTDTPFNILDYYQSLVEGGHTPDYYNYQLETLHSLTANDICRVFSDHILPAPKLVTVARP